MNGFKTDLTKKILGLNPHIVIQSSDSKIEDDFEDLLIKKFENIRISKSFSGEGLVLNQDNAKGIIIKGIDVEKTENLSFFKKMHKGNFKELKKNTAFIGAEMAFNLNLDIGDKINLMSSAFVSTPFGGFPKQETYIISGIFRYRILRV